jgi:neural Wiskott-Aldrich syndrome protein
MPAQSSLSSDEKSKIKSTLPASSYKIFSAVLARIYYAHPNPAEWSYAGLQGALALVQDKGGPGAMHLKLIDVQGTRGVVWKHELYKGFEYNADRGFFHSFAGDVSFQ